MLSLMKPSSSPLRNEQSSVTQLESPKAMSDDRDVLSRVPVDAMKHIMTFCGMKDIASFSKASSQCLSLRNEYSVDMVRDTAWLEEDGYHILNISSTLKHAAKKNLSRMTLRRHAQEQFMLVPHRDADAKDANWAMFVKKAERGNHLLKESKGYWKVLYPHLQENERYASLSDLDRIKSLVMHKAIAPKLLDYASPNHPFRKSIHVSIHDRETGNERKYEVLFWNGSDIGQVSAFKITKCGSGKTNYYMHGAWSSQAQHVQWLWYDNNSAQYRPYDFGEETDAQIECTFQSNLPYNFPHTEDFRCVTMNKLKQAYVGLYGQAHQSKSFMFRFGFKNEEEGRQTKRMVSVEQLTITDYSFSRNVQRLNLRENKKVDFCHEAKHFNLRMEPCAI